MTDIGAEEKSKLEQSAVTWWIVRMKNLILSVLMLSLLCGHVVSGAEHGARLKVLVVTGGHGFEQEPFFKVFKENPEIAFTATTQGQTSDAYDRQDLLSFDVVVLYDMVQNITEAQKAKFLSLLEKGIGLLVMHHALVSYQDWPEYERIIGGKYLLKDEKQGETVFPKSNFQHDVEIPVTIVAKEHPITAGLKDFIIHDEIYMDFRSRPDVTPLITTSHPKSGKPLAWTRTQGKSRVVYLQLGHDHSAYENPNYRRLVAQSIRWVARHSARDSAGTSRRTTLSNSKGKARQPEIQFSTKKVGSAGFEPATSDYE